MKFPRSSLHRAAQAIVLSSCALFIAGCSSDDDSAGNNTSGTSTPNGSGGQTASNPFADALAGTWLSSCDNSSSGSSRQQQLTVTGLTVALTRRDYSDLDCRTPATPAETTVTSSVVMPGGTTTTSLGEATHVDVTPESVSMDGQPASAEVAAAFSTTTVYDIMLIADEKLYFGDQTDELDASTAEKRPDTLQLEEDSILIRQ